MMNEHDKPGRDDENARKFPEPANDEGRDSASDATLEALAQALGADAADSPRIAELEGQVDDLTDRLLRAAAETENVRRRAEKERDDLRKFAVQKFAEDMLAVADNLKRALDAVPAEARGNEQVGALVEGVELTGRELAGAMERHGIRPIDAAGKRFDPNLHQAMFEVPGTDYPSGTVAQVIQPGYAMGERLLRPALVGVAKGPSTAETPTPEAAG